MTLRDFDCAVCGGHFTTRTPEAEVSREFLALGRDTSNTELLSTCDDCYAAVIAKAKQLGVIT